MLLPGNPQCQTTAVSAFQVSKHTERTYKLMLGKMGTQSHKEWSNPVQEVLFCCSRVTER